MNTDLGAGKRTKTTRFFGVRVYDYGFRFYDPELARFHTLDPLTEYFPRQSPFVYANNNPVRYIDFLGLSAQEPDEPIDGGEIEEVVCVGTRPSTTSSTTSWWTMLVNWWNSIKPRYEERYVNDPMSQDLRRSDVIGFPAAETPVISRENWSLFKKVFKIVGDTEEKTIEKTIPERVREKLDNNNEPTKYRISRTFLGETTVDGYTNQSFYEKWSPDSTSLKIVRKGGTDTTYYPPKHY